MLTRLLTTLIDLFRIARLSSDDKDLEILILRQQLDILTRKQKQAVRLSRQEKWTLAVLMESLKRRRHLTTNQLQRVLRIFKPETEIGWHRKLVRRKWTQKPIDPGGRPSISEELQQLIVQLAKDNTRWGYGRSPANCRN